ncbi:hypothetical protein Trydic_g15291 [Trypoxylus dichotomus]
MIKESISIYIYIQFSSGLNIEPYGKPHITGVPVDLLAFKTAHLLPFRARLDRSFGLDSYNSIIGQKMPYSFMTF